MRQVILIALPVAGIASPSFAAASAALPVTTSPLSLGGVVGTSGSTVTSSSIVIKLGSITFANLTCSGSTCTGTVAWVTGTFTLSTLDGMTVLTSSAFPNHGAWVSAVANWASNNRTSLAAASFTVGDIVSGAARIEGPLALANRIPNQSGAEGKGTAVTAGPDGHPARRLTAYRSWGGVAYPLFSFSYSYHLRRNRVTKTVTYFFATSVRVLAA